MDSALPERLKARHPEYLGPLGQRWWKLARDAYEGTGGFRSAIEAAVVSAEGEGSYAGQLRADAGSYLVQFTRETETTYARRQRVSTYQNYVSPCARTYRGHLWKRPVQREATDARVKVWWDDTDGDGTSIGEWMAEGSRRAQLDGWAAAIFDRPEGDQPATSASTIARWLDPEEVVAWELDARGGFRWVRLWSRECTTDPFTGDERVREVYTTWTDKEWWRVTLEGKKGETLTVATDVRQPHSVGAVPVVVLYWTRPIRSRLYGVSPLDGVVSSNLELYNVMSEQREHERGQVFGIFCVQSQDPDVLAGLKLGTNNGLRIEPTMGFPQFVAPPESIGLHYSLRITEIKARIYEAAGLEQPKGEASAGESGVAKSYDFKETGAVLIDAAGDHQRFEYECADLVARWAGDTSSAVYDSTKITYPREFDLGALRAELDTQFGAIDQGEKITQSTVKAARIKVARGLNPDMSPDEERLLQAEVEALYQFEKAAFDARTKRTATPASEAATDAAIAQLPEAAPGVVVSTQAAPNDAGTTSGEGE